MRLALSETNQTRSIGCTIVDRLAVSVSVSIKTDEPNREYDAGGNEDVYCPYESRPPCD